MAIVELGKVFELKSAIVDEAAINVLRAVLEARTEVFFFDCKLCGAERPASVIDPGVLMFRDYTCADISARCKSPPTPRATKRLITFRPGSLVLAPIDPDTKKMWPGIIEDCPEGKEGYFIPGKTKNTAKAYFVTFIFPNEPNRKWLGGFIAAKEIRPIEQPDSNPDTTEFNKSFQRAYKSVPSSLRDRLLKFSFVAHVASSRSVPLGRKDTTSFWSMFFGKRKSSAVEADFPRSPSGAETSEPSYSTKLPKLTLEDGPTSEEFERAQQAPSTSSGLRSVRPRTPLFASDDSD